MPSLVGVPLALSAGWMWLGVGALAWVAAGVGTAIVLERRGHDLRSLLGLAVVLGPLFVPLGLEFVRRREPTARPIHLDPVPVPTTGLHAVVAVLGAPESVADALPVLASYGKVTAVTLARTIDYETAERRVPDDARRRAEQDLAAAATFLTDPRPARVLVPGTPETALARLVSRDHDLIVITGAIEDVGAERLSDLVGVPVVVAPRLRERG